MEQVAERRKQTAATFNKYTVVIPRSYTKIPLKKTEKKTELNFHEIIVNKTTHSKSAAAAAALVEKRQH